MRYCWVITRDFGEWSNVTEVTGSDLVKHNELTRQPFPIMSILWCSFFPVFGGCWFLFALPSLRLIKETCPRITCTEFSSLPTLTLPVLAWWIAKWSTTKLTELKTSTIMSREPFNLLCRILMLWLRQYHTICNSDHHSF